MEVEGARTRAGELMNRIAADRRNNAARENLWTGVADDNDSGASGSAVVAATSCATPTPTPGVGCCS